MISKIAVKKLKAEFLDCDVIVYLKDMNVIVPNEQLGEVELSAMLDGIVADIDQDYLYLTDAAGLSFKAIPHDTIGMVELAIPDFNLLDPSMASNEKEIN